MLHLSAISIGAVILLQQGIDSRSDALLVNNPPYLVLNPHTYAVAV